MRSGNPIVPNTSPVPRAAAFADFVQASSALVNELVQTVCAQASAVEVIPEAFAKAEDALECLVVQNAYEAGGSVPELARSVGSIECNVNRLRAALSPTGDQARGSR